MSAYEISKRAVDVAFSLVGLVVLSPVMLITAIRVGRDVGRPVLFRQSRPGRGGAPFTMYKFRTMRGDGERGIAHDQERITRLGGRLRASSIDELPSLVNVLRGDMSLVGPRPLLMTYLPRYTVAQARRHEVRPGVTGLAQVSGRNALDWDSRLALDVEYVDRRSWPLDLRILLRTIRTVGSRSGITADGQAAGAEFLGRRPE